MPEIVPVVQPLDARSGRIHAVPRGRAFCGDVLRLTEIAFQPDRQRIVCADPVGTAFVVAHQP